MMARPTFLIVGTAKAGTTSLWRYLDQHPDIFMSPVKEPAYFAYDDDYCNFEGPRDSERFKRSVIRDWASYQDLFTKGASRIARAEASTMYLYVPGTPQRIHARLPGVKIIAVLRNPVDRAFSAYLHCVRDGVETVSFEKAIELDRLGRRDKWLPLWHYWKMGLYYRQVLSYYDVFGAPGVQVHLYEDLKTNAADVVRAIAGFVGVRSDINIDTQQLHNVGGIPRFQRLHQWLTWSTPVTRWAKYAVPPWLLYPGIERIKMTNLASAPQMSNETRHKLLNEYRDDIEQLERLIGRDLSHWLGQPSAAERAAA